MIKGMVASKHGPRVNHIFFADDGLLFENATRGECEKV